MLRLIFPNQYFFSFLVKLYHTALKRLSADPAGAVPEFNFSNNSVVNSLFRASASPPISASSL